MRLYLKLTKNTETIPFNYQPFLTGAIHKWIGDDNSVHNKISLYSFSWLQNAKASNTGITLTKDSFFFISAFDESLIKKILKGILNDPAVCFGVKVFDIQIAEDPKFSNKENFWVASPIFIKRRLDNHEKHITYDDPRSNLFLTETLQKKLKVIGLPSEGVQIAFDRDYPTPQTKIIKYKEIGNRVNLCPVIIEGSSEQITFAWNVGIGNSTGIGFGALK
ncbi:MAG TPA: CRISPR-associated endoribonuclease Cas6 [Puia sp.]|nr:CRISPR-associated endoribonuclease Cas6 [Puia sp.]